MHHHHSCRQLQCLCRFLQNGPFRCSWNTSFCCSNSSQSDLSSHGQNISFFYFYDAFAAPSHSFLRTAKVGNLKRSAQPCLLPNCNHFSRCALWSHRTHCVDRVIKPFLVLVWTHYVVHHLSCWWFTYFYYNILRSSRLSLTENYVDVSTWHPLPPPKLQ